MQSLMLLCIFCAVIGEISPAAIPMWEYLSKDEKMSYLYSMFANQVEEFCESADMRNCNRELLKFGLGKLKDMPEDHLDTMDPYQRGAHNLIWDSMMQGHEMMTKRPQQKPAGTTTKPNSYNDQSFSQDYQGQASAKIETVYRVPPPKNFFNQNPQYTMSSGSSQYRFPNSVTQRPSIASNYQLSRDSDDSAHAPLTGPMVVKVHLDGTPVRERADIPHDEDLRQYHMSKARIPNF